MDFHTYTGKDVYEYNSQTTIDIDSYSLNDNLNHFFNYSTDEFVKIAKNTQKEIVPVIMKDEMMVAFDDIQSFKDKIEYDITYDMLPSDETDITRYAKIVLNSDMTISLMFYGDEEKSSQSTYTLGYMYKETLDHLTYKYNPYKVFGETVLHLDSIEEDVELHKLHFDIENDYYDISISFNMKNFKPSNEIVVNDTNWEYSDEIPF